jgi:hypothetical protein
MSTLLESRLDPERKAEANRWDIPARVVHPAAEFMDSADQHIRIARQAFVSDRIAEAIEEIEFAQAQLARARLFLTV